MFSVGGAYRSYNALKIDHDAAYQWAQINLSNTSINTDPDHRYLHLNVKFDTPNPGGNIQLVADGAWGDPVLLGSANTELKQGESFVQYLGLSQLPIGEWNHLVVDLHALNIGNLNAIVVQNGGAGANGDIDPGILYYLDEIGLHGSKQFPARLADLPGDWAQGVTDILDKVVNFRNSGAIPNDTPILLGEFGSFLLNEPADRAEFAGRYRAEAEARGMDWCYWNFGAYPGAENMGIFDPQSDQWLDDVVQELIPNP